MRYSLGVIVAAERQSAKLLLEQAIVFRFWDEALTLQYNVPLLINDRVDVHLAIGMSPLCQR